MRTGLALHQNCYTVPSFSGVQKSKRKSIGVKLRRVDATTGILKAARVAPSRTSIRATHLWFVSAIFLACPRRRIQVSGIPCRRPTDTPSIFTPFGGGHFPLQQHDFVLLKSVGHTVPDT